jgi:asparagine synthase (glutamine-hydrolysing)
MCGISGIRFKRPVSSDELERISQYFAANMRHRGPDSYGVHRDERSVFVNVRLAIVDRAGGDQPIYAPGKQQGIVYNGEVYNWQALRAPLEASGYPFATHTDTEAVLAAFVQRGEAAFAEMNGMFAACIWNEADGSFTLARDRFGSKPLYIYEDEACIAFASEIKTLLGLPGVDHSLNPLAFQDYLTYRYALAPHTFFRHIEKLPAGCALRFDANGRRIRPFAEIAIHEPETYRQPREYVEALDSIMESAVRSQLMGEVPIGLLLSGGLDSSAIAYYVQRNGARMKAYNIGFAEVNEFAFSRDVARQFDLDYVEICMTQDELLGEMEENLIRLDEPIADPACFALSRLCRAIREDVTVVLSGEGGDEMFAGYGQHLFSLDASMDRATAFAHFFHASVNNFDAAAFLRDKQLPPEHLRYKWNTYDTADTALNGMLAFELRTWMPENLMMKADKVLMSHSLEGRFPFLDLDLYRFAAALPQAMKLPSTASSKHVLRLLMADKLPSSVIERRKMGFTVPPAFFLQHLQARFREALALLRQQPVGEVLDLDAVQALADAFYTGQGVPVFKVWNLFVLVYWFAYVYPLFRQGISPIAANVRAGRDGRPSPAGDALPEISAAVACMAQAGNADDASGQGHPGRKADGTPALQPAQSGRQRLAVYTVLIGDKEYLNDPLSLIGRKAPTDLEIDFICFTDDAQRASPTWRMVVPDDIHLSPERQSRRPKCLPHEYLPEYEYSLYIDNTVVMKRLPCAADLLTQQPQLLRMFKHPASKTIEQEADVIVGIAYEDVHVVCDQIDHNRRLVPDGQYPELSTAAVILRGHLHPQVKRFGVFWWEEFLAYSRRDQLAVDFAAWRAACPIEHWPGLIDDNEWMQRRGDILEPRVKANFDEVRYAWVNRHDPEAVRNPRAHFLQTQAGKVGIEHFSRRPEMFEYLCHFYGSSLGARVSPRHGVAGYLGEMLAPYRSWAKRILVIRVDSAPAVEQFLEEEHGPAMKTFAQYFPEAETQFMGITAAQLCKPSLYYAMDPKQEFEVVAILGVLADDAKWVFSTFAQMLPIRAGVIAVLLAGSGTIEHAELLRQEGKRILPADVHLNLSLFPARHDSSDGMLVNGLWIIEWRPLNAG